ncbi:MAG: hypothetical protein WD557_10800 [Dehalococcoidia bacterium]
MTMRIAATAPLAALLVLLGMLAVACEDDADSTSDFARFRELVAAAGDVDYEPLAGPLEAVGFSDAIVLGEVVDATIGTELLGANSEREVRYIILKVAITAVLAGTVPGGEFVYVALAAGGVDPARDLEEALPETRTLLVLDDWRPSGQLEGFPEQVYAPFTDGAWFEVGDEVEGLWVDRGEVEERWGEGFGSIDELAALLEAAAAQ